MPPDYQKQSISLSDPTVSPFNLQQNPGFQDGTLSGFTTKTLAGSVIWSVQKAIVFSGTYAAEAAIGSGGGTTYLIGNLIPCTVYDTFYVMVVLGGDATFANVTTLNLGLQLYDAKQTDTGYFITPPSGNLVSIPGGFVNGFTVFTYSLSVLQAFNAILLGSEAGIFYAAVKLAIAASNNANVYIDQIQLSRLAFHVGRVPFTPVLVNKTVTSSSQVPIGVFNKLGKIDVTVSVKAPSGTNPTIQFYVQFNEAQATLPVGNLKKYLGTKLTAAGQDYISINGASLPTSGDLTVGWTVGGTNPSWPNVTASLFMD